MVLTDENYLKERWLLCYQNLDVIFTEAMAGQLINQDTEFLPRVTVKIKPRRQAGNIHVGKFIAYSQLYSRPFYPVY